MNELSKAMNKAFANALGQESTHLYVPKDATVPGQVPGYTTSSNSGDPWIYVTMNNVGGMVFGCTESRLDFIPVKIIFSPPATICYFIDGSKVVVKCGEGEEFEEEEGVMACIVKKIYQSRNAFKKAVAEAYRQPPKEEKVKAKKTRVKKAKRERPYWG